MVDRKTVQNIKNKNDLSVKNISYFVSKITVFLNVPSYLSSIGLVLFFLCVYCLYIDSQMFTSLSVVEKATLVLVRLTIRK